MAGGFEDSSQVGPIHHHRESKIERGGGWSGRGRGKERGTGTARGGRGRGARKMVRPHSFVFGFIVVRSSHFWCNMRSSHFFCFRVGRNVYGTWSRSADDLKRLKSKRAQKSRMYIIFVFVFAQ